MDVIFNKKIFLEVRKFFSKQDSFSGIFPLFTKILSRNFLISENYFLDLR